MVINDPECRSPCDTARPIPTAWDRLIRNDEAGPNSSRTFWHRLCNAKRVRVLSAGFQFQITLAIELRCMFLMRIGAVHPVLRALRRAVPATQFRVRVVPDSRSFDWRSEQMAVALDFPRTDREMIGFPFYSLVMDEFVAQLLPKRSLHQGIGREGRNGFLERLRQELDLAVSAFRFRNRIEIILIRRARIDLLANAFQTGGE